MKTLIYSSLTIFFLFLFSGRAGAGELRADIERLGSHTQKIQNLELNEDNLPLTYRDSGQGAGYKVRIEGEFKRTDWSLLIQSTRVTVLDAEKGTFEMTVVISRLPAKFSVVAIGPLGQIESEQILIKPHLSILWERQLRPHHTVFPTFAVTSTYYSERNDFSQAGTYFDLGLSYRYFDIQSPLDVHVDTSITTLPLSNSVSGSTVRYLKGEGTVGYTFNQKADTRFGLRMGLSYLDMIVSPASFGISNLVGILFSPEITKDFDRNSLSANLKYISYNQQSLTPSTSDFGLGIGCGWTHWLTNGKALQLNLEMSELKATVQSVPVDSSTFSLNFGYLW